MNDHVATHSAPAFSDKTWRGHARHVRIVRGKLQEERAVSVLLYEVDGLAGQDIRLFLVIPARGMATSHVADAADTIDNRSIMPSTKRHPEQLRMIPAGRLVADRLPVADADRIHWVETDDTVVFDIHARHAVGSGWLKKA